MDGTEDATETYATVAELNALSERVSSIEGKLVEGSSITAPAEPPAALKPTNQDLWEALEPGLKWGIENGQIDVSSLTEQLQTLVAELSKTNQPAPAPTSAEISQPTPVLEPTETPTSKTTPPPIT